MKKLLSLLLAVCMIASIMAFIPVFAGEAEETVDYNDGTWTAVSTVDEFKAMAADGKYYLANDIDFEDVVYDKTIWAGGNFTGVFDGRGYSLLGIVLKAIDSNGTGVFNRNFSGTIKNVTFGSKEKPAKATSTQECDLCLVTGSFEQGDGNADFVNVTIYADILLDSTNINPSPRTAAFGGWTANNFEVNFTNCHVYGSISGAPTAGFVAANQQTNMKFNFTDCTNNATIASKTNKEQAVAGFIAMSWSGSTSQTSKITFKNCVNNGNIEAKNYNGSKGLNSAAGFASFQSQFPVDITMENCVNNGTVKMGSGTGAGLVSFRPDAVAQADSNIVIKNSVNNGTITYIDGGESWYSAAAGILAVCKPVGGTFVIENCANYGDVTSAKNGAGGIMTSHTNKGTTLAKNVTITGCVNLGNVTSSDWRVGGIVGMINNGSLSNTYTIKNCVSAGAVTALTSGCQAGGIIGDINIHTGADVITITDNYVLGTVSNTAASEKAFAIGTCDQDPSNDTITIENNYYVGDLPLYGSKLAEMTTGATKVSSFSEGSLENNTVSTAGISGYVSARVGATEGLNDLRFVLAVDLAAAEEYETISVTIDFCDATGTVKTYTLGYEELGFYLSAKAAGITYTAAEGDALFGAVVKNVPADAWSYVVVTVSTASETSMVGVATTEILADATVTPDEEEPVDPVIESNTTFDLLTHEDVIFHGDARVDGNKIGWISGGAMAEYKLTGNYDGLYKLTLKAGCADRRAVLVVNGIVQTQKTVEGVEYYDFYFEMVNGENTIILASNGGWAPDYYDIDFERVGDVPYADGETITILADDESADYQNAGVGLESCKNDDGSESEVKKVGWLNGPNNWYVSYTFTVEEGAEGTYGMLVGYLCDDAGRRFGITIDDGDKMILAVAHGIPTEGVNLNDYVSAKLTAATTVELTAGTHTVIITGDDGNAPNFVDLTFVPLALPQ